MDDPELPLYEDDLVGLVDRNLSADHRVAQFIAEQIRALSKSENRREQVRNGLKAIQYELRVTDLSSLDDASLGSATAQAFRSAYGAAR